LLPCFVVEAIRSSITAIAEGKLLLLDSYAYAAAARRA
jgi:hypothetical protein